MTAAFDVPPLNHLAYLHMIVTYTNGESGPTSLQVVAGKLETLVKLQLHGPTRMKVVYDGELYEHGANITVTLGPLQVLRVKSTCACISFLKGEIRLGSFASLILRSIIMCEIMHVCRGNIHNNLPSLRRGLLWIFLWILLIFSDD